jgi:histone H3/H4
MTKRKRSRSTHAIPRATFARLVKEISNDVSFSEQPLKWSEESIEGLQEEAEAYVANHFRKAHVLLDAFKQSTLRAVHFKSAEAIVEAESGKAVFNASSPCLDMS